MHRKVLSGLLAVLMLSVIWGEALAAKNSGDDEDGLFVNAKVVEVADCHISIVTRGGAEHVIAIDGTGTRVTRNGRVVSIREVSEGDIITVELDANKQVKFAKNISIGSAPTQVARNNRR
ncbi:MAG TPA: hypothetical protein VK619_08615 [Pyrinomonadaceae bacterium]|nr:hypothetical protein [Pyrinomonadaceae bacterium]